MSGVVDPLYLNPLPVQSCSNSMAIENDRLQGLFVLPTVCSVEQSLALSAAAL